MTALRQSVSTFERWFRDDALALWRAHGYDAKRGGFYECLDFTGAPITGRPRRVRVQARQIHTFSQAALRGWGADCEALAAAGFDYFLAKACPDEGARGCVHHLSDDGTVLDDRRDLYDQAFALLACASRWQAAQDARALALAERIIAFLNHELASPHGGWLESDRHETPRRQNPHMHLLEAFMALYRATGDSAYRDYAAQVYALFETVFFDQRHGVLHEFFNQDFAALNEDEAGLIQPGHMMEWIWLLGHYDALFATDSTAQMTRLYSRAEETGLDSAGFLRDTVRLGKENPPGPRRLWPQTEYIKAAITLARRGDKAMAARAGALIDMLFKSYLAQPVAGLWCDQFGANGAALARDVPASILYHLFEAVGDAASFEDAERSRS